MKCKNCNYRFTNLNILTSFLFYTSTIECKDCKTTNSLNKNFAYYFFYLLPFLVYASTRLLYPSFSGFNSFIIGVFVMLILLYLTGTYFIKTK